MNPIPIKTSGCLRNLVIFSPITLSSQELGYDYRAIWQLQGKLSYQSADKKTKMAKNFILPVPNFSVLRPQRLPLQVDDYNPKNAVCCFFRIKPV
jgi:hypothetical protein